MASRFFLLAERALERSAARLLARVVPAARADKLAALGVQFAQFGVVGLLGMLVDAATVYLLRHPIGLIGAGFCGYLTAASFNWGLNRIWTFRPPTDPGEAAVESELATGMRPHRQWALFLLANLPGFVLNRGTFVALVQLVAACRAHPILAIAAGSVAGMFANFTLSRRLVFR